MIKKLKLKNFKCFKEAAFNFTPLTVFCGANSAGKSTALQALLLLKQSSKNGSIANGMLSLAGEYFSFGHVTDVMCHSAEGGELSISIDSTNFNSEIKLNNPDDYQLKIPQACDYTHEYFTTDFHYLSAYRLCPQNSYDVNCDPSKIDIGIYGQYAISELNRHKDRPAANQILAKKVCPHLIEDGRQIKLGIAFQAAMRIVTPGFEINLTDHKNLDKVSNTFPIGGKSVNEIRPVNTGFGISYVLPIVLALLCTHEGGHLLIENPEVHLHPAAQSKLAELLTMASTCGIQVIVETHSDHIINGMRAHVKENAIQNGHVTIHSVRAVDGERNITEILIDDDGGLSDMDVGFFDQAEIDLMRLF
ncbi:DUF3696 domain-containing protein [Pseudomonas fulva]|uniref:AAA family ATPase n=1 Tax=Pseudomonas fulva TaxID=47880 RepID=UPI003461A08E